MKRNFLPHFVNRIGAFSERHAPELLTGIGVTGVISTIVLTVVGTIKSVKLIDEEKKKRMCEHECDKNGNIEGLIRTRKDEEPGIGTFRLSVQDTVKLIWKPCLPAVLTGAASIVCLISANAVSAKRSAALTAAYAISETAFRDYREKVVDIVGDKKEDEIHTAVVQDKIDKTPLPPTSGYNEVIFADNGGEVRCFDAFAGRYFRSSRNRLGAAINDLNRMLLNDGEATLNDFYYFADLENTEIGESLVWCVDKSYDEVNLRFSSHLSPDGQPCLAFCFDIPPSYVFGAR